MSGKLENPSQQTDDISIDQYIQLKQERNRLKQELEDSKHTISQLQASIAVLNPELS